MACVTIRLTENALTFLRHKVPGRKGIGAFLSTLVAAEEAREEVREELRAALAQKAPKPTRQDWEQTGVRVD